MTGVALAIAAIAANAVALTVPDWSLLISACLRDCVEYSPSVVKALPVGL